MPQKIKFNLSKQQVEELYIEKKLNTYEIATIAGVSPMVVRYWLDKLGVKKRNISEALKLAYLRGRKPDCNLKGEQSPAWKGGRIKAPGGYIQIYKPDHPRAVRKYVLEHVLVLEEQLGRYLLSNEIGHHLNGIKSDNRPKNLVAIPKGRHSTHTLVEICQKRIKELEAELSQQKFGLGVPYKKPEDRN